jgi:uncharacterized protein (TIGR00645 family)
VPRDKQKLTSAEALAGTTRGQMSDGILQESPRVMPDAIDLSIERQIDKCVAGVVDQIVSEQLKKSLHAKIDQIVTQKIEAAIEIHAKHRRANRESEFEKHFENRLIFGSRWILAPAYLFLVVALIILLYQAALEVAQLLLTLKTSGFNEVAVLIQALTMIDVVLVMNLLLMVILVGYTNFVSKIHASRSEDWPDWTRHLDYSGLKLQVLGSIIAISAIGLLREFFDLAVNSNSYTRWQVMATVGLYITFVLSALVIALVNRLHERNKKDRADAEVD